MTTSSLVETMSGRSRHVLFDRRRELHRLEVIQKIRDDRLSVVQAAEKLDLSRSQVHRLLQAYDLDGAAGLVTKMRSRLSNRRHSQEFGNAALDLISDRYLDFCPTLAREKVIELHRISIANEALRQWMTEAGIDVSHHWWFENRGPKCALLVYIDDATGRSEWTIGRSSPLVTVPMAASSIVLTRPHLVVFQSTN